MVKKNKKALAWIICILATVNLIIQILTKSYEDFVFAILIVIVAIPAALCVWAIWWAFDQIFEDEEGKPKQ